MGNIIWLANKLNLSGEKSGGLSAGTAVAVLGVALSVAIMEVTLAVVLGFKTEIRALVTGFDAPVTVNAPYDYTLGQQSEYITLTPALKGALEGSDMGGIPYYMSMRMPTMLKTEGDFSGVVLVGSDSGRDTGFERGNMVSGKFPDFSLKENDNKLVLSAIQAKRLGVAEGDDLYAYFFANDAMKARRLKVAGVYSSGLDDYDKNVAYASIGMLRGVARLDSLTATRIEFGGIAPDAIDRTARKLQSSLDEALQAGGLDDYYPVTTVHQTSAMYFNWLALLDTNVVVIIVLMLCVGLFTLASSLYMIILDRLPTIALFKALGSPKLWLCKLFVGLGVRLALIGMLLGNIIGVGVCLLQLHTGVAKLDPKMYYLAEVPIEMDWGVFAALNAGVLLVAWLVLFVPAWGAANSNTSVRLEK